MIRLVTLLMAGTALQSAPLPAAASPETGPHPRICAVPSGWNGDPISSPSDPRLGERAVNTAGVAADGTFHFNRIPTDAKLMSQYLDLIGTMEYRPVLVLYPLPGAGCEALTAAASLVEKQLPCEPGLCFFVSELAPDFFPPPPPPPPPPFRTRRSPR